MKLIFSLLTATFATATGGATGSCGSGAAGRTLRSTTGAGMLVVHAVVTASVNAESTNKKGRDCMRRVSLIFNHS